MTSIQDSPLSRTSAASAVDSASTIVDTTATVSSSNTRNVRFGGLRKKRSLSDRNNTVKLASYNSDFLLGIFADVAKAKVLKEFSIELPSSSSSETTSTASETICPSSMFDGCGSSLSSSHVVLDSANNSPRPLKKSRVSFHASSYQSRASCMNLLAPSLDISSLEKKDAKKQDSLAYQLDCLEKTTQEEEEQQVKSTTAGAALAISAIASISLTNKGKKVIKDVAALAFPNLPSTISDSSCESNNVVVTATGLTRKRCLVPHGSALEIAASPSSSSKESFGWFVDLDDDLEDAHSSSKDLAAHPTITDKKDLAFQAHPTSPKRGATNHVQEEMEQAYAADTIDSVFGDLF